MSDVFTPLKVGNITLGHRVVMAPLTRFRAPSSIPGDLMKTYYEQRTSKGGLIITEASCVSEKGGIPSHMPRIDTLEAAAGWKKVVDGVHNKGGFIFCQVFHLGRTFIPEVYGAKVQVISSSNVKISDDKNEFSYHVPKVMDAEDMKEVIEDFVKAADNAINKSGFDGIELHGANGYLLDQFIEDSVNTRTDEFGGSIENRCKFPLMVLDAVIDKIGADKVGYRISPWDTFQEAIDSKPLEHFSYFCEQLEKRNLAYVHIIEARSDANGGKENDSEKAKTLTDKELKSSLAELKTKLPLTPVFSAGGWNSDNFTHALKDTGIDALVFGRYFISNPDLPEKLKQKKPLTRYDRLTFYTPLLSKGYIDY